MANFLLIRDLCEKRNITLRELAKQAGVTEGAIQKIMATGSTKTSTLEVIARILEVPAGYFFDDYIAPTNQSIANGNGSAASIYGNATTGVIADKDKEIEHLKALLEEKERVINEKERTIQILINK